MIDDTVRRFNAARCRHFSNATEATS